MSALAGSQIAVIGLGASGLAAARLALDKGGDVYVSDLRTEPEVTARRADLRERGAQVELGRHDIERLEGKLTWLSSVQESPPRLLYSEHSRIGLSGGSPNLNSLFSSSLVH
ncbi:MAG: hypothetical protein Ct9H300mP15_22540 [Gemmatimonadota bacterium]|nr:MAG: hypothetical protein Ct9H300mP15_22540 [Gemmatimonadota bacterium]